MDKMILSYLSTQRFRRLKTAYPPHTIIDPTLLIGEMRLHKTPEEVAFMQKAGDIAAEAHILAMQNCQARDERITNRINYRTSFPDERRKRRGL